MMHFTDETWVDFVRNTLPPAKAKAMRHHLDQGCGECHQRNAMWKTVADMGPRVVQGEPADSVVCIVKAAFHEKMRALTTPKQPIPAVVVFDSFRNAVPAGFRAMLVSGRHLLHHAGPWVIALRLKMQPGNRMFAAGHVMKSGSLKTQQSGLQITLAHAGTCAAQTFTDAAGEFYLQSNYERDMQVHVWISPDESIVIQLPDPEGKSPARKPLGSDPSA